MKLSDTEQNVLTELEKSPHSGITKAEMAQKWITFNLGDIIMKLRRKGKDISTDMRINAVTGSRFAVYLLK